MMNLLLTTIAGITFVIGLLLTLLVIIAMNDKSVTREPRRALIALWVIYWSLWVGLTFPGGAA